MARVAPLGFSDSTIGKKVTMALSGVILLGFVVAHMLGNLQVYLGAAALNAYSDALHAMLHGAGLWLARGVLLAALAAHVASAVSLARRNRAARPTPYKVVAPRASSYASRTMYASGPILAAFIVYHLLHLTLGVAHQDFHAGDVYRNVVTGFSQPAAAGVYVVAMLALGVHMYHGVWSLLQTLGLAHARWNHLRHTLATLVAAAVVIGNISFPVAVLAGVIK